MKMNKKTWIVIISILAGFNLVLLLLFPDWIGYKNDVSEKIEDHGQGKAKLEVAEKKRTFNGAGLFDPLDGVKASDTDGKDISDRIAVTYISKESIQNKEIHYIVYDSENEKLEDVSFLYLKNYEGPKIKVEAVDSVSWKNLQNLNQFMVEAHQLYAEDGFGNDVSNAVAFSFRLLPETKEAEVTFSLVNQFQDCWIEKLIVGVEDFPEEYEVE